MSEEDNTVTILPIDNDNKDEMKKRNTIEEVDTNIQIIQTTITTTATIIKITTTVASLKK